MTPEVKERITQIRHGIVPEGYRKTKAGIVPTDWSEYAIADCLERVERPVEVKAEEMYTQIGIRSHGKGLFYKEPVSGMSLGNKAVFWVEPDCFVLNIVFAWEQAIGKTTQAEVGMIGSHRFPMYRPIDERVDIDYLIYYLMTKRGKDILEAASPGGAGRNRTLGQDRFMNSKIVLPTPAEQKKIAEILTTQDKVIELEQQKIEEIMKVKQFFLGKMFPKKGQALPEIRFKGFTDVWEQRKFSDLAETRRGLTYNPTNIRENGVRVLRSSNIDEDHFVCGNEDVFVVPNAVNIPYVRNGDILITSANGSTRLVGKHAIIREMPDKSAVHGGFMLLASAQNPEFVNALMGAPWYAKFIALYVAGGNGAIGNLNKNDLDEQNVFVPSDVEQKIIGAYFQNLDNLITLHQRKLEEEKKKKKGLMQLLLTGIVRVRYE